MGKNKILFAVVIFLTVCVINICFMTSTHGGETSFEVQPRITLPEYRTDTARAIDAYERVMDRFMSITEDHLGDINTDVRGIAKRLVSIDYKLAEISTRMARIENALEIKQSEKPEEKSPKGQCDVSNPEKIDQKGL